MAERARGRVGPARHSVAAALGTGRRCQVRSRVLAARAAGSYRRQPGVCHGVVRPQHHRTPSGSVRDPVARHGRRRARPRRAIAAVARRRTHAIAALHCHREHVASTGHLHPLPVRSAGTAHPRCHRGARRTTHPALCRTGWLRQSARPASAPLRRRCGESSRLVPATQHRASGRGACHAQGRRRVCAAGSGTTKRTPGLPAGGQSPTRSTDLHRSAGSSPSQSRHVARQRADPRRHCRYTTR